MEDNQNNILEAVTEVVEKVDSNESWSKEAWKQYGLGVGVGVGIMLGSEYVIKPATKAAWRTAKAWYKNRKIKKEQSKEKMENLAEEIVED